MMLKNKDFLLLIKLSDVVFIMLTNVKMPTMVGILTFMSMINFMLSWVEHDKSFITSRPDNIRIQWNGKAVLMTTLLHLTLEAPITTAADGKFCDNFPNFRQK